MNCEPRTRVLLALPLLVALSCNSTSAGDLSTARTTCSPTYRFVTESPIDAEVGTWRVVFSVVLIGCQEDLAAINAEQLESIVEKLHNPTEWSLLLLLPDHKKPAFRRLVAESLNAVLPGEPISDVLFNELAVYDHLQLSTAPPVR